MRQDEQQSTDHPETVRSAPVLVPPSGDRTDPSDRGDAPEYALDDRDTGPNREGSDRGRQTADRPEFHDPAPVPTAFGATTVGGAVAAAALASGRAEDEPDPRTEATARPGDGVEGGEREGWRADPAAEFRGGPGWEERRQRRAAAGDETVGTVLPPDAAEGAPERRADLIPAGGDPDAVAAGAAGYGSATPNMVDPDAVSPDTDPVLAGAAADADGTGTDAGATGSAQEGAGREERPDVPGRTDGR
ncbi:hypothetical protein QTQ03_13180 [Micromonospora sp. WMMA1363]|uniref:hypothetical protein n=1 Tax=Micromonospora sp. WMMA1363 TaxID=3053985 RepID=UPI00259CA756|nr:hypothetical protein [Micromonospora sp. WMMA1363]MDM4720483.1 hypothetical protein [Micromonospora sp. WMMA1363]